MLRNLELDYGWGFKVRRFNLFVVVVVVVVVVAILACHNTSTCM